MSETSRWSKLSFILLNGAVGIGLTMWLLSLAIDIQVMPGRMNIAMAMTGLLLLMALGAGITAWRCRNPQAQQSYEHDLAQAAKKGLMRHATYAVISGVVVVAFTYFLNHIDNPLHHLLGVQLLVFGASAGVLMLLNQYWMKYTYSHYLSKST